jgi:IMP dehydrogenase/GMP reductase
MIDGLSYDDVLLVPQLGVLEKREDADLTSRQTTEELIQTPIIAAPMPSVTETEMARAMLTLGGQAVIHRFQSEETRLDQYMTNRFSMLRVRSPSVRPSLPSDSKLVSTSTFSFARLESQNSAWT